MRRSLLLLAAILFAIKTGSAIAQDDSGKFVEPPTVVNGWGIVLSFDSKGGPEGDHSHWFHAPTRYKTKEACDKGARGGEGEFAARFSAAVVTVERREGYKLENIKLDCRRLPEKDPLGQPLKVTDEKDEDQVL